MSASARPSLSQLARERIDRPPRIRPTVQQWSQSFVHHPLLDPLGYVWHPGIKLLICKICNTAVSSNNAAAHSGKNAGHAFVNRAARAVIRGMEEDNVFGEREGRLSRAVGGLPPLAGFETVTGYQCSACDRISEDADSIRRHFNKAHGSRAGIDFPQVRAQYLFKGRYGVMFALDSTNKPDPKEDAKQVAEIAQKTQTRMAQLLHDEFTTDWTGKDTWQYLQDVPWHTVLQANHDRFTVGELKSFVNIPRIHTVEAQGTLARSLALAVEHFFLGAETSVRGADYRLRQWVGSESNV